jgi:predicted transcriptional regulator
MSSDRPPVQFVTDPAMWAVLNSPIRLEIAETLRCIAPCSVAELAEVLNRPADTLYRQLEQLEQAGFVRRVGFRKSGRHVEQLVDLTAGDFLVDFEQSPRPAAERAIVSTARSALKGALHAFEGAAAEGALKFGRARTNTSLLYELSWLSPAQFEEVRGLLRRLKEILDAGKLERSGDLYLTVALATPVVRKHRPRRRGRPAPAAATPSPAPEPTARGDSRRPARNGRGST